MRVSARIGIATTAAATATAAAVTAAAISAAIRTARSRLVATLGLRGRRLSIRAIFIERRSGGHVWIYVDRLRCSWPKYAGCATLRPSAELLLDASARREEDERQNHRERHRAYKHGREGPLRRRRHRTFHSHRGCGRWASRARKRHRSVFVVTSRSTHRQCLHDMWGVDRYGASGRHHRPAGCNDQDNLVHGLPPDRSGFAKGFRKNIGGRWRRLVKRKPESETCAIPPELKDQLKTIYVY